MRLVLLAGLLLAMESTSGAVQSRLETKEGTRSVDEDVVVQAMLRFYRGETVLRQDPLRPLAVVDVHIPDWIKDRLIKVEPLRVGAPPALQPTEARVRAFVQGRISLLELEGTSHAWLVECLDRGCKEARHGHFQEGIRIFEGLLAYDADDVDAHAALGEANEIKGSLDEAVAHLDAALRIDPTDLSRRLDRGGVLFRLGRLDDAQRDFDEVVRLDHDLKSGWDGFARAWLAQVENARPAKQRRVGEPPVERPSVGVTNPKPSPNKLDPSVFSAAAKAFDDVEKSDPTTARTTVDRAIAAARQKCVGLTGDELRAAKSELVCWSLAGVALANRTKDFVQAAKHLEVLTAECPDDATIAWISFETQIRLESAEGAGAAADRLAAITRRIADVNVDAAREMLREGLSVRLDPDLLVQLFDGIMAAVRTRQPECRGDFSASFWFDDLVEGHRKLDEACRALRSHDLSAASLHLLGARITIDDALPAWPRQIGFLRGVLLMARASAGLVTGDLVGVADANGAVSSEVPPGLRVEIAALARLGRGLEASKLDWKANRVAGSSGTGPTYQYTGPGICEQWCSQQMLNMMWNH